MDIQANLNEFKGRVLREIEDAAHKENTQRIVSLSDVLREVEADEQILERIRERLDKHRLAIDGKATFPIDASARLLVTGRERAANGFRTAALTHLGITPEDLALAEEGLQKLVEEGKIPADYAEQLLNSLGNRTPTRLSARQRGKRAREKLASEHHLTPEKGAICITQSGSRVGIATASETKPNSWFLGLPDTPLRYVALLCQQSGEQLEFILPKELVAKIWPQLSRSGGQVKFNVLRRNSSYQLQVPGLTPQDITGFIGAYGSLM